jgi:HSP20 family protein
MNRVFSSYRTQGAPTYPAVNVWTGEDGAILTAELPGVNADDLDISVVNDTITISGKREAPEVADEVKYILQERGYGNFNRSVQLPFPVEPEQVDAKFQKGVLRVELPRAEQDRPRKISVKSQ